MQFVTYWHVNDQTLCVQNRIKHSEEGQPCLTACVCVHRVSIIGLYNEDLQDGQDSSLRQFVKKSDFLFLDYYCKLHEKINEQNLIGFVRVDGVNVCIRGRERNKKTEELLPNPIKYFSLHLWSRVIPKRHYFSCLPMRHTNYLCLSLTHTHLCSQRDCSC